MKKVTDIRAQIASIQTKQKDLVMKLQLAELANNNEEMLIIEMQLAEAKGIVKALEWVLK